MSIFQIIKELGIIPVLQIPSVSVAKPIAKALIDGGIPLAEIMFRNECAAESIKIIKEAYPKMCIGGGTILNVEQVMQAKEAGADFIVSPGFNEDVVKKAIEEKIPILPGCVTPTEIEAGLKKGLKVFKFFPVKSVGGISAIKELVGPYKDVTFVVTGGLEMADIDEFASIDKIIGIGGGFVTPDDVIKNAEYTKITELCKEAIQISLNFHLCHIGINGKNSIDGEHIAKEFANIFGIPYKRGEKSDFAGSIIESTKINFPGTLGHIAIGTKSVERAIAYLKNKGIEIRKEFLNVGVDRTIIAAYLKNEIAGFAIHLLKDN